MVNRMDNMDLVCCLRLICSEPDGLTGFRVSDTTGAGLLELDVAAPLVEEEVRGRDDEPRAGRCGDSLAPLTPSSLPIPPSLVQSPRAYLVAPPTHPNPSLRPSFVSSLASQSVSFIPCFRSDAAGDKTFGYEARVRFRMCGRF